MFTYKIEIFRKEYKKVNKPDIAEAMARASKGSISFIIVRDVSDFKFDYTFFKNKSFQVDKQNSTERIFVQSLTISYIFFFFVN